jgi:tRNA (guanine10-N2)-dimethyltransferase
VLSRESTGVPEAEARTLVEDADPTAEFESPEDGLLVAETTADPAAIEARVAFSRRVGMLVPDGELDSGHVALLRSGTYRVRVYGGPEGAEEEQAVISSIAERVGGKVSLDDPDREVAAYACERGARAYLAITTPRAMRQGWARRRPRSRAFFHPSAIFPKLSRAIVNLSGARPGDVFLDPFCGTGSLLIEASIVGAEAVGIDLARKMVRGARRNSLKYEQPWLGTIRADARRMPVSQVAAIATDVPYGRASSARGSESGELLRALVEGAPEVLPMGAKLVVMHPKSIEVRPVADAGELRIERELDIYIHRTLTRTITVLRRVGAG